MGMVLPPNLTSSSNLVPAPTGSSPTFFERATPGSQFSMFEKAAV
jgi:hypothetical protein